jgi:diacylglycerol kinase family enzyme
MELIRELRRLGISARLFGQRAHLDRLLAASLVPPPLAIVAAGGDGTAIDLLNRHPDLPIALLPLGTENLLARSLGIPRRDGGFVARMIAEGRTYRIDLGEIGTRRFAVMASCGFDADVLARAHAGRQGHITRGHYIGPILDASWHYGFPELTVSLDDSPHPLRGGLAIVANLPEYALGLPLAPEARGDDGLLHVRVFPHRTLFQLLRDLGNVHWRHYLAGADSEVYPASHVRITAEQPTAVQADGDPVGLTPVDIRVIPHAALLLRPADDRHGLTS